MFFSSPNFAVYISIQNPFAGCLYEINFWSFQLVNCLSLVFLLPSLLILLAALLGNNKHPSKEKTHMWKISRRYSAFASTLVSLGRNHPHSIALSPSDEKHKVGGEEGSP